MSNQLRMDARFFLTPVVGVLAYLLVVAVSDGYAATSPDMPLVRQGKPLAKIVLGSNASGVEKHAATELQKYVKQISGAKLDIISEKAAGSDANGAFVLIGTPESSELVSQWSDKLNMKSVKYDGFVIRKISRNGASYLVLASPEARGCLYAVYDLLKNALDVGFFWAGDRVPKAADLSIMPAAEKISSPYFRLREYLQGCALQYSWMKYWNFKQWKKEIDWAAKHKFNEFWYPCGNEITLKRAYKRLGVDLGGPTAAEKAKSALAHQVINYARSLGMKVVSPGFNGPVSTNIKKIYPDANYIEIQWTNLPPRLYLYPSDPLFVKLGQYMLEEYAKEYGTDHLYDIGAYGEVNPGNTRQEKLDIKLHFAKAVCEYIRKADPKGIWRMSGWALRDRKFWPVEEVKLFLDAIPNDMYLVNDICSNWEEPFVGYKRLNYYYGKNWGFGVAHSFGGQTFMHGRMQSVINKTKDVMRDKKADKCIHFYLDPEVIHYNPFYFELITDLSWNPGQVSLENYISRYAVLRYGRADAPKMKKALDLLARSVYGDKSLNSDRRGYPQYWKPLGGAFPSWVRERRRYIAPLRQSLEIMLNLSNRQKDNPFFVRDLVDVARSYVGELFNYHVVRLYKSFTWDLSEDFEKEAKLLDTLLQFQERLLSCWKPYQIRTVIDSSRAYSPYVNQRLIAHEVKRIYSALNGLDYYPRMLDYASNDMYELLRDYYRPRVDAYIDGLRQSMSRGESRIPREKLNAMNRAITEKWIKTPLNRIGYRESSQVVPVVRDILDGTTVPEIRLGLSRKLENGGFEAGKRGWQISFSELAEVGIAENHAAEGKKSLHFKLFPRKGRKKFSYDQQVKWINQSEVTLQYYLVNHTLIANASLMIEAFTGQGEKKAQLVYFFGGDNWGYGNVGPKKTGGFYAVKKKVASGLKKWHLLIANPEKDLDAIYGKGLWKKLSVDRVRISIRGWCNDKGKQRLEGFIDDVKVVPPDPDLKK